MARISKTQECPCRTCLVKSMCNTVCNDLIEYAAIANKDGVKKANAKGASTKWMRRLSDLQ